MVRRLNELAKEPGWYEGICARVAEGEMLTWIGKNLGVKDRTEFGGQVLESDFICTGAVFRVWIECDEKRSEMYEEAVKLRDANRRDEVQKRVYETALREVEKVSGADMLRAAEMVLNPKAGVTVQADGTGKITVIHESS